MLDIGLAADPKGDMGEPFWKRKSLSEMTDEEWESLCDGCGKCCLAKLEDEDTGEICWTSIGCRLFDGENCRCKDYENRFSLVPDCVRLTPENAGKISWLPKTCAYRLLANGRDLPDWHPLVTGDPDSVHGAGISVKGCITASEDELTDVEQYFAHVLEREP
jgi:uncharacterized cysteine cluster protein YcgN (CxxCxxCC family)